MTGPPLCKWGKITWSAQIITAGARDVTHPVFCSSELIWPTAWQFNDMCSCWWRYSSQSAAAVTTFNCPSTVSAPKVEKKITSPTIVDLFESNKIQSIALQQLHTWAFGSTSIWRTTRPQNSLEPAERARAIFGSLQVWWFVAERFIGSVRVQKTWDRSVQRLSNDANLNEIGWNSR